MFFGLVDDGKPKDFELTRLFLAVLGSATLAIPYEMTRQVLGAAA